MLEYLLMNGFQCNSLVNHVNIFTLHFPSTKFPSTKPNLQYGLKKNGTWTRKKRQICEKKTKDPAIVQKLFSSQRDTVIAFATDIFRQAFHKGKLRAEPLLSFFYPRGCSSKEWQVAGSYDNFFIAILGDTKGIKLFKIFEKGEVKLENITNNEKFLIDIKNGPKIPLHFRNMLDPIFTELKNLSFLGEGTTPISHRDLQTVSLERVQLEKQLQQKVRKNYPNEVGGLYFEGNQNRPTYKPCSEGDTDTLTVSHARFFDKEILRSTYLRACSESL